jgi:formylglycine-generating enzyme required for sulfatase activity
MIEEALGLLSSLKRDRPLHTARTIWAESSFSIRAGQFPMGCSEGAKPVECSADEKPRHTVQVTNAFEIGKTEVTQKQWQAVMG